MVPFDKPVLSRVEGLRTGSGSPRTVLLGELTTNRWFDRLITNGVVGELTTNRWFDEACMLTSDLRSFGVKVGVEGLRRASAEFDPDRLN
jgi:hypothetical protein